MCLFLPEKFLSIVVDFETIRMNEYFRISHRVFSLPLDQINKMNILKRK